MEDRERTLVAALSMHRCGSSLTAHILQNLGMSLGPFDLIGAEPANPYGHFEAIPFNRLNRRIQSLAYGFTDDLPESPEILARFLETRGSWDASIHIPDEFLGEGRSLIRTLIDSGRVSGFKDPRTVLTWPFWERVLADFPGVRIIPLGLIRSPHEIAMSLVSRRGGWRGYWTSLDVIDVHFHRQKQILESHEPGIPCVCFGSPSYLKTLEIAVREVGLTWDACAVLELVDRSAMHQRPAAVAHDAQRLFESMSGDEATGCDPETGWFRLEQDARLLEGLRLEQWKSNEERVSQAHAEAGRLSIRARDLEQDLLEAQGRATDVQNRLSEAQNYLQRLQSQLIESERKLIEVQEREIQAWRRTDQLRTRLDRFESHPLLGPALRGRRRLRRLIHSVGEGLSAERNGPDEPEHFTG
jgi:hypothetical protein